MSQEVLESILLWGGVVVVAMLVMAVGLGRQPEKRRGWFWKEGVDDYQETAHIHPPRSKDGYFIWKRKHGEQQCDFADRMEHWVDTLNRLGTRKESDWERSLLHGLLQRAKWEGPVNAKPEMRWRPEKRTRRSNVWWWTCKEQDGRPVAYIHPSDPEEPDIVWYPVRGDTEEGFRNRINRWMEDLNRLGTPDETPGDRALLRVLEQGGRAVRYPERGRYSVKIYRLQAAVMEVEANDEMEAGTVAREEYDAGKNRPGEWQTLHGLHSVARGRRVEDKV